MTPDTDAPLPENSGAAGGEMPPKPPPLDLVDDQLRLSTSQGQEQEPVLISGEGFGPRHDAGSIAFNGVPAHVVTWSNQNILTFVPYGATSGALVVLTKRGQSFSADFTVLPGVYEPPDQT